MHRSYAPLSKKMILSWFPGFNYTKNIKHIDDKKFICVLSCHQNLAKSSTISQRSRKKKGVIFMAHSVYIKLQQKRLENKSLRKSFGLFIISETKQYELTNIQCYTQAIRDAK